MAPGASKAAGVLPDRCAVLSPINDERTSCHRRIDRRRDVDRALHANEREKQHGTDKTGSAGAERVDIIEQTDRAADIGRSVEPDVRPTTGSVAPISKVGMRINQSRLAAAVSASGRPTTRVTDAVENSQRDNAEGRRSSSSIAASSGNNGISRRFDSQPPARLPRPRPSMKAVTTIVTDSMLTPKMRKSARCQVSW